MSKGWRKGQKEKFLATMKRKKEEVENKKNCATPSILIEQSARLAEFQFRRGLVTAMECILRELR
jgi:hypothetical protein